MVGSIYFARNPKPRGCCDEHTPHWSFWSLNSMLDFPNHLGLFVNLFLCLFLVNSLSNRSISILESEVRPMPYPAMRGMTRYTTIDLITLKLIRFDFVSFQTCSHLPWLCHARSFVQDSNHTPSWIHRATAYGHTPRSGVSPYPAMRAFSLKLPVCILFESRSGPSLLVNDFLAFWC